MKESMENQEIDEESYNGSYKATKNNDSSHQWKVACKILLQSLSPTQFHQTFVFVFLNHKCSNKSSSSSSFSSNSSFGDDHQKSLSNRIPPHFCLCVLESQNSPNLLHMFLFCGTTYWAIVKVLWVIHIHHSQKFWSILGGGVS